MGPILALIFLATSSGKPMQSPQVIAAFGVLSRTIGPRSRQFRLRILPKPGGLDEFTVNATHGRVEVTATSGVALCRGAYQYLKSMCHSMVSWEGTNLHLPKSFPPVKDLRGECPVEFRHYYNICTFGYTTAFWKWPRWQREIDWMALHGINMPLAMTGQDKVWQTVFRSYGIPQSSIDRFFSGPAFQPWHWMGNLNGYGGPTPQSWLDGQAALQKKILRGERALGMKPVVPGFSGFVPVDFAKFVPGVRLDGPTSWGSFEPTKFIDVRDPKFIEVGKRFVNAYRKEFGTDHYYLCDTFNEQNPQFPESSKLSDLAKAGDAVYQGLRQGDDKAVWIMQGWLFLNESSYWQKPEVEALLSKVPEGRMIILDLGADSREIWREQPAMARKGFIYCSLLNFGQNTAIGGAIQANGTRQYQAQRDAARSPEVRLSGFGLTPEGIDQNPIEYEFLTDMMWTDQEPNFAKWLPKYVADRYGIESPLAMRAWRGISKALYSSSSQYIRDSWRLRPTNRGDLRSVRSIEILQRAIANLLKLGPRLGSNPLYQRDMVDVTKTWLSGIADRQLLLATFKHQKSYEAKFLNTLRSIDQVMACRPEHRLSTWISMARAWGKGPGEADLMERNARMQIGSWDEKNALSDYANKEWAGMVDDYVLPRWQAAFRAKPGEDVDYLKMEVAWGHRTTKPAESAGGNPVRVASAMLKRYGNLVSALDAQLGLGEAPGNLARDGIATDDGHHEGSGSADKAIDGDLGTYWAASPAPRVWQLKLRKPEDIRTVQIFPYWGDGRSYQYTVDFSEDGKSWTQVIDQSLNSKPSSMFGDTFKLGTNVSARFIRINMLHNSANIGVHLVEVRLYCK